LPVADDPADDPPAAPDSFADPAVLGATPVLPVLLPLPELPPDPDEADPLTAGLLGALVGDALADDDGLCSPEGDAFGEAE
jgi:hypothetical protein